MTTSELHKCLVGSTDFFQIMAVNNEGQWIFTLIVTPDPMKVKENFQVTDAIPYGSEEDVPEVMRRLFQQAIDRIPRYHQRFLERCSTSGQ